MDLSVRTVASQLQIIQRKVLNSIWHTLDMQFWECPRLAIHLYLEGIDMVGIDMCIAHTVHKASRLQPSHLGNQPSKQCVGGNIEWNS